MTFRSDLQLLQNGAVIDAHGRLVVRFVYGTREMHKYLLEALKNAPDGMLLPLRDSSVP